MRKTLMAAVLLLSVLAVPPAHAQPVPDPSSLHRVAWSSLKYEIARHRLVVGPNRSTGYGKMVITALVRIPGTHRYRAAYRLYDERRILAGATRTLSGFCWPWDYMGPIPTSGCAGWNNPGSWNWGGMIDSLVRRTRDNTPGSPMTYDREKKCISGAVKAGGYATVTKMGVGLWLGQKWAAVRPTPLGWAITMIGGCLVSMWW